MTDLLSKTKQANVLAAKEENFLDWKQIPLKLKSTFGNDVYESWIKNISLKKEFNHYVVLSARTRFVREWIVSRYADKLLDIIKTRIEIIKKMMQYCLGIIMLGPNLAGNVLFKCIKIHLY